MTLLKVGGEPYPLAPTHPNCRCLCSVGMPCAPDRAELWEDDVARAFLEARGFVVGADFIITRAEATGRPPSTFEASAIDYLVDEWDYVYEGHDED